jgi:hypothetical protein
MPPSFQRESLVWLGLLVLIMLGCGIIDRIVGPRLMAATWVGGLAYFW